MTRDHVPHLVRQHGSKLELVVSQRDQAARHIQLAVRQRKSVDRLRIEHRDFVFQVRPDRCRHQPFDGLLDDLLQPRVVIDAAIGGENALMLALHRRRHVDRFGGLGRRLHCPLRFMTGGDPVHAAKSKGQRCKPASRPALCRSFVPEMVTISAITRDP